MTQVEPFPIEQEYAAEIDGVPMGSYIEWMRSNSRISVTGCPAISVPVGFSAAGLPVGLQLVTRPFGERALLEVAHAIEQHTGLASTHPAARRTLSRWRASTSPLSTTSQSGSPTSSARARSTRACSGSSG